MPVGTRGTGYSHETQNNLKAPRMHPGRTQEAPKTHPGGQGHLGCKIWVCICACAQKLWGRVLSRRRDCLRTKSHELRGNNQRHKNTEYRRYTAETPTAETVWGSLVAVHGKPLTRKAVIIFTPTCTFRRRPKCTHSSDYPSTIQGCKMAPPFAWGGRALPTASLDQLFAMVGRAICRKSFRFEPSCVNYVKRVPCYRKDSRRAQCTSNGTCSKRLKPCVGGF